MGRQKPDYVWYVLLTGGCVKWHLQLLLLCIILYSRKKALLCNEKGCFPTKYKIFYQFV